LIIDDPFFRCVPHGAGKQGLWLGPLPERAGLANLYEYSFHLAAILSTVGNPIRVQPPAKIVTGKEFDQVNKGDNPLGRGRIKAGPIPNVLFRPEEVHGTSGMGNIFCPLPIRYGYITHEPFWVGTEDLPVADLHGYWETAVEAGSIDLHRFTWKEPADRQRFKPSLAEPFLLTLDGDPVLSGQVVEGSEGGDVVCIRE
jgi:hypothetical protein